MRIFSLLFFILLLFSLEQTYALDKRGLFSGRISKINSKAALIRVKVDFMNAKYLNKKDRVEFWNDFNPNFKCIGHIKGKTSNYLLIKILDYYSCKKITFVGAGGYLKFFSKDLIFNIEKGEDLISILLKKRLAVSGRLHRYKRELDISIEKMDVVNKRFQVLQDKIRSEWRGELDLIEEDRVRSLEKMNGFEIRLGEIDHKLEKYKIDDENMKLDRWSLDDRLYFRK